MSCSSQLHKIAPIVFLRTQPLPYWESDAQHAIVVVGYDENSIFAYDPAFEIAPQKMPISSFLLAWDGIMLMLLLGKPQKIFENLDGRKLRFP